MALRDLDQTFAVAMGACAGSSDKSLSPFLLKYSVGEQLAAGAFGEVRVCHHRKTKANRQETAVRSLTTASVKQKIKANRQGNVLRLLGKHQNLVELIDHFDETIIHHLVLERCQCSIIEKMNESEDGRYHDVELLDTFRQVLLGLQHCHSKSVAHRDVKASKILIGVDGAVKLSDFSNAIVVPSEGISGLVGTVEFMAPEMLEGRMYGCKADIWSCGATAYFLFYGEHPNHTHEQKKRNSTDSTTSKVKVMQAIRSQKKRPTYVSSRSHGAPEPSLYARNFIDTLLQQGSKRPHAREALTTVEEAIAQAQAQRRTSEHNTGSSTESAQFYTVTHDFSDWTEITSTMSPCSSPGRSPCTSPGRRPPQLLYKDDQLSGFPTSLQLLKEGGHCLRLDNDDQFSGGSTSLLSGQSCTTISEQQSVPSKQASDMPPVKETSDMVQSL